MTFLEQLAALSQAGYSKEDIQGLMGAQDKGGEKVKQPQDLPSQDKPAFDAQAEIGKLTGMIKDLQATIQAGNIRNAGATVQEETIDDVFARIIGGGK